MDGTDQVLEQLKTAVNRGRLDVLKSLLVELGNQGDLNLVNSPCLNGDTLLHYASKNGMRDALRVLLSCNADPSILNTDKLSAVQVAASDDVRSVFSSMFRQAIAENRLELVKQLIKAGIPLNAADESNDKNSPLHWAAAYAGPDTVEVLCLAGCDLNVTNAKGQTPLHIAINRDFRPVVQCLLRYGADSKLCSNNNVIGNDTSSLDLSTGDVSAEIRPSVQQQHSNMSPFRQLNGSTLSLSSDFSVSRLMLKERSGSVASTAVDLSSSFVANSGTLSVAEVDDEERPWHCLLWPQPHLLHFSDATDGTSFVMPERKLRIYFYAGSTVAPSEMISLWRTCEAYVPKIRGVQTELEFAYDVTVAFPDVAHGALWCGVFPQRFKQRHSYSLRVVPSNVEMLAADALGLKYAINTFLQAVNLCTTGSKSPSPPSPLTPASPLTSSGAAAPAPVQLPYMKVDDWPDFAIRAVLLEFTGCRIFNLDTLRLLCSQMSYLKCSHLIISFEVRVQDKFSLPYSPKDLFQLKQYCRSLGLEVIPSLDVNCREIETSVAFSIISEFLEKFAGCSVIHLGRYLAQKLLACERLSSWLVTRLQQIFLDVEGMSLVSGRSTLPPVFVLCFRASTLSDQDLRDMELLPCPICLTLPSGRPGFLCPSLDYIMQTESALYQLLHQSNVLGTIVCDLSSGCELVAPVVNLTSKIAVLGLCWNCEVDFKSYTSLLPLISAVNVTSDNLMETLFRNILRAGAIEWVLTLKALNPTIDEPALPRRASLKPDGVRMFALSVPMELLLNPDNIDLDSFSAIDFKRCRHGLLQCLQSLRELEKKLPYNYELALCVVEVKLIVEVMAFAAKVGQALCMNGKNPNEHFGTRILNAGVSNLPLTTRTDLANRLLQIRNRFQHSWLSRNMSSTLPNVLKIFDNMFRLLLPPTMSALGESLL